MPSHRSRYRRGGIVQSSAAGAPHVFATVTRNTFGLRSLVKRFHEFGCAAMTSLKSVIGYAWFQRWRIVKSNESFVNYWFKNDGMIVRIPVYLSSLLLALTSKFYFAKIWTSQKYELHRVFWETLMFAGRKLKTIFWLRSCFRVASYAVLFLIKNNDVRNKFLVRVWCEASRKVSWVTIYGQHIMYARVYYIVYSGWISTCTFMDISLF